MDLLWNGRFSPMRDVICMESMNDELVQVLPFHVNGGAFSPLITS